jgi:hypothetical protein
MALAPFLDGRATKVRGNGEGERQRQYMERMGDIFGSRDQHKLTGVWAKANRATAREAGRKGLRTKMRWEGKVPPNKQESGRWHKSLLHPEGALAKLLQSPSGIGSHRWLTVNFGAAYMEEVGARCQPSFWVYSLQKKGKMG